MMTPRIMTALSCAVILSVPAVAATASSKAPLGPKHGSFTCDGAVAGELAFLKGNKYVLAGGDTSKFVYQTGRGRIRFKTGDVAAYAGSYDRASDVITLVHKEDGVTTATCARTVEEPVVEEPTEPTEPTDDADTGAID
jgi:hypothetical protein